MQARDEPQRPGAGIRILWSATTVAAWAMVAVTALAVILSAVVLSGRGSVGVDTSLEPPYAVQLGDGSSVTVEAGMVTVHTGFDMGDESRSFETAPTVHARVEVDRSDTDTRIVAVVCVAALLALGWVGLVTLRRIVGSARDGDPFDPQNVNRFRWLAAAVVAARLVVEVGDRILARTLDVDVAVDVTLTSVGWVPVVAVALGLLALSEIFRTGSELRQFEREAV